MQSRCFFPRPFVSYNGRRESSTMDPIWPFFFCYLQGVIVGQLIPIVIQKNEEEEEEFKKST